VATIGAGCDSSPNSGFALQPNPARYDLGAGLDITYRPALHSGALRRDLPLPLRRLRALAHYMSSAALSGIDRWLRPYQRRTIAHGAYAEAARGCDHPRWAYAINGIRRQPHRDPLHATRLPPGCDSGHPGPRPAGALRASKIARAILSNPVRSLFHFEAASTVHGSGNGDFTRDQVVPNFLAAGIRKGFVASCNTPAIAVTDTSCRT
jgi:hypothetical protein